MAIDVPDPVAHYLAADAAMDTTMLAQCFAQGAVVRDEGRDYLGLEAIQAWNREAHRKYQYVLEPVRATTDGADTRLRVRLTGPFPGSPVEVDYLFTVREEKITSLRIG